MYKALSVRCQRCTKKKKNKEKIMLSCIIIGACAVQFLHCVPLYRNTQHYATLNCSIKTRLCAGGTSIYIQGDFHILIINEKVLLFYAKNNIWNFQEIFTFWDPVTLDKIIGLNWALAYFIGAKKLRASSLISHIQTKLW